MEEIDIRNVIRSLEGYRTSVLYDSIYPALSIMKSLLENYRTAHIVSFSNSAFRILKIVLSSFKIEASNLKHIVINKTGECEDAYASFSYEDLEDCVTFLSKLKGLMVFYGNWILKKIVGDDEYWRLAFELFDLLDPDAWVFSFLPEKAYSPYERSLLSLLYDVTMIVKKVGEPYMFGEEVYSLEIFESIIKEVLPGTIYFKVGKEYSFIPR